MFASCSLNDNVTSQLSRRKTTTPTGTRGTDTVENKRTRREARVESMTRPPMKAEWANGGTQTARGTVPFRSAIQHWLGVIDNCQPLTEQV